VATPLERTFQDGERKDPFWVVQTSFPHEQWVFHHQEEMVTKWPGIRSKFLTVKDLGWYKEF
jgi:hypothetical protein